MAVERSVKASNTAPCLVAVIASAEELQAARRMRRPPDLFELRLDAFATELDDIAAATALLRAPLIITARDPGEGGLNHLSAARRREMLLRFLPRAAYVDVELRSVTQLRPVLQAAFVAKVKRIISVHEFRRSPGPARLCEFADAAEAIGPDVFKIAMRTETPAELDRLLQFFDQIRPRMTISAMGVGKLGRASRRMLARRRSALNYVHLGTMQVEGQLSLAEMRRVLKR